MTYVEYMRRLGVSVEPEVKAEVEPVVETVSLTFTLQRSLDRFMSNLPSKTVVQLNASWHSQRSNYRSYLSTSYYPAHTDYFRRAVEAVEAELASRVNPVPFRYVDRLRNYTRSISLFTERSLRGASVILTRLIADGPSNSSSADNIEYYRRALLAVEAELASRGAA
jgi:hypothetical protein